MTTQIFALVLVVAAFALLFAWAFWPGNKARFEAHSMSILDTETNDTATAEGEKS